MRVFRQRTASALIAIVLCATVGMTTVGAFVHGDDHAALPAFVEHDASAHSFQAATSNAVAHPLHCLVCHWARSFRLHPGGVSQPAPAVEYSLRIIPDFALVPPAALAALPPLRSPPTAA